VEGAPQAPGGEGLSATSARQTLRLDPGWLFHHGDIDAPLPTDKHLAAYMANKAGYARGAAKPSFDDSSWQTVDLPHDWSVEGPFDQKNYLSNGFLPRGVAWYRRHFKLDESDRGKYLAIQFDGVATHCTVWVNGHLLHRNFCGYTPFTIDISDIARFGDDVNTVAVRVDATTLAGWWYEGAGIYRHVWLIKSDPLHIQKIFVDPQKAHPKWVVPIQTTIRNSSLSDSVCRIVQRLAGATDEQAVKIAARSSLVVHQSLTIQQPTLWSVDEPNLHELQTTLRDDAHTCDHMVTTVGFRTMRFDPEAGFFLNDQPLKLKGTCNHQDHAGVGVAVPASLHEFRIRRLKEMGCNAYRSAHNPPAPDLLDACDRLGMLVIDENRNFGSSPEHLSQLRSMVLRDRNHPSVIMWSICNEEAIQGTPVAANITRSMQAEVKQLDPSRPVTAAVSGGILNDDGIANVIEVCGINYQLPLHDQYHAKHPRTPLYAAETHCVLSTRGVYTSSPERHVLAMNDLELPPWGTTARQTWRFVSARPFIAGIFLWTGFDYRGEPTPFGWPCVSSQFGMMDACGFPKDGFYLHKAFFDPTGAPFVHLSPHWNWQGKEDQPIEVVAYTNCDSVELFLNEESLGRLKVDSIEMARWQVRYRPGVCRAVAYRGNERVAEARVETTGKSVALGLQTDAISIPADGEFALPISVFAVDDKSGRVPTANDTVSFEISGATIIGAGNGDPTSHEPDKAMSRSLFNGLAQVIIRTTTEPGPIRLTATAPGLLPATLELTSVAAVVRPVVPVATQVRKTPPAYVPPTNVNE
jgi:beta-galactosidase